MKSEKRKIGILFASGTVLSIRENRSIFFIEKEADVAAWLAEVPELSIIADITPAFILGEKESFGSDTIEKIVEIIGKNESKLDGFVVLVRADNMVRAAVAGEFMLQGFGKPIVFTGSRYSPEAIAQQDIRKIIKMGGLGLRSNLINAVQIAADDNFPATAIMFGNKVIKPTRAAMQSFYSTNLFRSVDDDYLGKVDFGITLYRNKIILPEKKFLPQLSHEIMSFDMDFLNSQAGQAFLKTKGTAKGSVMVHMRENEIISLEQAELLTKRFRSVCAVSENYVLDQPPSIFPLARLTWSTAVVKAQWAQTIARDADEFSRLMTSNLIGEFLPQ